MRRLQLVLALSIPTITAMPLSAQTVDSVEARRIAGIARVWSALRFRHPWIAYRADIDLDGAAMRAISALDRAGSTAEFREVIREFIAAMGDPATRLLPLADDPDRWPSGNRTSALTTRVVDGALIVGIHYYPAVSETGVISDPSLIAAQLRPHLQSVHAVVMDARTDRAQPRPADDVRLLRASLESALRLLTEARVVPPAQRTVMRSGYRDDVGPSPLVEFRIAETGEIPPATGAVALPIVLLVNENSELPEYAAGLALDGRARVLAEGIIDDAPFARHVDVDAGEGIRVRIRTTELIDAAGRSGVPAAEVSPRGGGSDDAAIRRAVALTREPTPAPLERAVLPSAPVHRLRPLPRDSLPSRESRIFALVKFWGVVSTVVPPPDSAGVPWSRTVEELTPRMAEASTVTEYHLALAALTNRLHDSHSTMVTPQLSAWRGTAVVPITMTLIGSDFVVREVAHDSLLRGAVIRPGDIVRTIDGEPALARGRRLAATMSSSSPHRADIDAVVASRWGPPGSMAALTVSDASSQTRAVGIPRYPATLIRADLASRLPAAVRRITPDVGYLDPSRLSADSVDAQFAKVAGTRALILDLREGSGNSWPYISRLMRPDSVVWFNSRPVIGEDPGMLAYRSLCYCRNTDTDYQGRIVVLIGPRQQSSAEVNPYLLKLANGTPFIGAATSGTLGGTARVMVPGGVTLVFTPAMGPDRRGLQPDIPVKPTRSGLKEGRDEVLEAALSYLKRKLGPP